MTSSLSSPQSLPAGTLTFLLSDVEGSTRLWEEHPEEMRAAMARHDALIDAGVTQNHGALIRPRGEGDSRFAVFQRPTEAVAAASTIQRFFSAEAWPFPAPLRIRVALHTGEAQLRDGDYYGTTVNRCARVRGLAHGGQTLISLATSTLVQDELPAGVSLRDLGQYKLKDLRRSERVYQMVIAGLPDDFPPLREQDAQQGNLPSMLTSFVGREREMAEVSRLMASTRLLTVSGAGGAGKTSLTLRVAPELLDSFAHGIWFVDLAPLSNPSLIVQQVMNVLGIREEEGLPLTQTLIAYLRHRNMILILDNCEHLLPDVSHLAEALLLGAPQLKILATSREPLGVAGEAVWWIPPLTSPDPQEPPDLDALVQYEAVKLFMSRAAAVRPEFELTEQNAPAVAHICAHLDGMPLAIELAAARMKVLKVEEIAARLGDRFHLLVGSRAALMRQQTLQALIDWSHDLLTDSERLLFRRLSVFSGGFTLEAVEEVCSGGSIKRTDVLELLSRLIDKSLLMTESQEDCIRYRLLETIHQYSQDRLKESKQENEFARKHAIYFWQMAGESYGELWGPKQLTWLPRLEAEYDNLRKALEWMGRRATRKEMLLRMTGSLWRFWAMRGHFHEGRAWLARALEAYSDAPPGMLANALRGAGILACQQGDYVQAQAVHERSLALFRETGDRLGIARELESLGEIALLQGVYTQALELHEASLALMREIGDKKGVAIALGQMGIVARDRGQYEQAREFLQESLELSRELQDKQMTALALKNMGILEFDSSEYQQAIQLFEEAVSLYRELKDSLGISNVLQRMGCVAKAQGHFRRATRLFRECLELKQELGERLGIAYAFANLAEIAFYQGRYPAVDELSEQSITLFRELGARRGMLLPLGLQGYVAHFQGDYDRALALAGECLALSAEIEFLSPSAYGKELFGLVAYARGDLQGAQEFLLEALEIFEKLGDRRSMAMTWINLARTAYRQGDHEGAMRFLDESLSLSRQLNIDWSVGLALEIMGLLERSRGNYQQALERFRESLQIALEQDNQQGIANCLGAIAGLATLTDQPACAASLFAAAQKAREAIGARMGGGDQAEYEEYLASAHRPLDEAAFKAAWDRGWVLSPAQAVEELCAW